TKQYNQCKKTQKNVPTTIFFTPNKIWWWYRLEFYTTSQDIEEKDAQGAIRALADQSQASNAQREPLCSESLYARVLGLRGRVTVADIKQHYRDRMQEYHPDKVAALGPKL